MSTYSPGTVAVATVRGVPNVRVMRTDDNGTPFAWCAADPCDDAVWATAAEVTDVRPLVVLDLGDNPSYVTNLLRRVVEEDGLGAHTFGKLANQIEAQTRPPKPEEPTGLGAVVEDAAGRKWVRVNETLAAHWRPSDAATINSFRTYADIDAVRILSAGVDQ